ncbi:MAG: TRAP transporter large permease subunit [Deltaproteobacteria bacterium]|nr:TRAP transporter large permease subunit [Deltaproteobacteria bacterium]
MDIFIVIILILVFILAILFGSPLFTIIGGAAVFLFYFVAEGSMSSIIVEMGRLANAPGMIAIPLFIFSGFIFAESNASNRLIKVSNALLGWLPGGLAVVTVIVCTIFTAMTGGAGVTIIACGGILHTALKNNGFNENFSLGFVTSSASSGVLFVPSLPIIIYGMIAKTDITQLFIAGIIPGLFIVFLLSGYGVYYGIKNKIPTIPFSLKTLLLALWEIKWVIPLPFVVIGGIYSGFITVGEAASVSAVYALISECAIYREISLNKLFDITIKSMSMVGAVLIVLGAALGLTNFLVDQEIPQMLMVIITEHISSKIIFLLVLNVFLLIVGCTMDIFSAIVVVVPLIAPVAAKFGIDPVHLGIIFLANLQIGYITPPVGMNLFIASLRFNVSVMRLYRMVIPALILFIIALLIISYWPKFSLFLLELVGQRVPLLQI